MHRDLIENMNRTWLLEDSSENDMMIFKHFMILFFFNF